MRPTTTHRSALSVTDAAAGSPVLARLSSLIEQSKRHLTIIEPLLPLGLKKIVVPGPLNTGGWCLLVPSGAAASKLRQLLPDLETRLLNVTGEKIKIRVKVLTP